MGFLAWRRAASPLLPPCLTVAVAARADVLRNWRGMAPAGVAGPLAGAPTHRRTCACGRGDWRAGHGRRP